MFHVGSDTSALPRCHGHGRLGCQSLARWPAGLWVDDSNGPVLARDRQPGGPAAGCDSGATGAAAGSWHGYSTVASLARQL